MLVLLFDIMEFGIVGGYLSKLCVTLPHMSICAGVIVAVALKQVDCTPDAKTCAQSDNESLKNGYCAIEKCHNIFLLKFEIVLRIEKALRTTGIKTGRKA